MSLLNLVRVVTATTGTGTVTLGAARTGFKTMTAAGGIDGQTYSYAIESHFAVGIANKREQGFGVWSSGGNTLTRNPISSTEVANAAISLNGDAHVFITAMDTDFFGREKVTTARSYYVNNSTGSDGNNGLSSPKAFATIQHAADVICDTLYIEANIVVRVETTGIPYNEFIRLRSWQGYPRAYSPVSENWFQGAVQITADDDTDPTNVMLQPVGPAPIQAYFQAAVVAEGTGARWRWTGISSDLTLVTDYACGHYIAIGGAVLIVEGGNLSNIHDNGAGAVFFGAFHGSKIAWTSGGAGTFFTNSHIYGAGDGITIFPYFGIAYHDSICEIDRNNIIFDDDPVFYILMDVEINSVGFYGHNFAFSGVAPTGQYFMIRDSSTGHSRNFATPSIPGNSFSSAGPYVDANSQFGGLVAGYLHGNSPITYDYHPFLVPGALFTVSSSPTNVPGAVITSSAGSYRVFAYVNTSLELIVIGSGQVQRDIVAANRTYYIRTDGSDANTGLANTSGGAFLTIQHLLDVVSETLTTLPGVLITGQIGAGTYDEELIFRGGSFGDGTFALTGDAGTPSNVIVKPATGIVVGSVLTLVSCRASVNVTVTGITLDATDVAFGGGTPISSNNSTALFVSCVIKLLTNDGWYCVDINTACSFVFLNCTFDAPGTQIAIIHLDLRSRCAFVGTITITGTPALSSGVFLTTNNSVVRSTATFSAAGVTGPRITLSDHSDFTGTTGATYLPGNAEVIVDPSSSYDAGTTGAKVGVMKAAHAPTTTDFPIPGTGGLFEDTSGNKIYMAYNKAGTLFKVELT